MSSISGNKFGKYRVEEQIGSGGFGEVWRAVDTGLDRPVALKILDPLLTRDAGWVARFQKEARVMARLDHPHIVPVYEIGEERGRLYIVMKLIAGPDLAQRLKQSGAMAWGEAVRIVEEVAGALDYAYRQGVVHRDLKPGNILLGPDGPALTDFGFARLVGDHSLSLSMSGGVVGTPAYIAPEVWEGQPADKGADIYALTCILYEMISGRALFGGETTPAIMMAHFQPPALPEAWPEEVPPGIHALLERGLQREPAERFETAGELARALARLRFDRLAEPYAALEAAVAGERWQTALETARQIRAEEPDYRDVAALETAALAGLERRQRAAWAAQWQQQAESALAAGNLVGARIAARRWQEMEPESERARAFLAELEQPQPAEAGAHPPGEPAAAEPDDQSRLRERGRTEMQALMDNEDWEAACAYAEPFLAETPDAQVAAMWKRAAHKLEEQAALRAMPPAVPEQPPSRNPTTASRERAGTSRAAASRNGSLTAERAGSGSPRTLSRSRPGLKDRLLSHAPLIAAIATLSLIFSVLAVEFMPGLEWPSSGRQLAADVRGRERAVDGMVMAYVPEGSFVMGLSELGADTDESPEHRVILDAFWIDMVEVTNAQYEQCVSAGGCPSLRSAYANDTRVNGASRPVVGVKWQEAADYCAWAGARLPTEAEWEYAARGPESSRFPWGDEFPSCDQARYAACGLGTISVGANHAGTSWVAAADMAGNVWEWVQDWYESDYYVNSPSENPTGPRGGSAKVIRGGSWVYSDWDARSSNRVNAAPDFWSIDAGFRCAR